MSLNILRIFFLVLCTVAGYAISQVREELLNAGKWWALIGFGFGGVLIAIDEMVKGFSLRAFSSATFGLLLGTAVAWMIDNSRLFIWVEDEETTLWMIRLGLFIGFGYIGMMMAMRSNKEDFSLIIPYVRFQARHQLENFILLDTSAIIDGRVVNLVDSGFLEGVIVVPKFVLKELHRVADSADDIKRARGRHGLEMLSRLQRNKLVEVKIHEGDIPEESEVDSKLVLMARMLEGKLYTCDYNLSKMAEVQSVPFVLINDLAQALKQVLLPGEHLNLKIVREGKDKGQGIGYLLDGTMVVVNEADVHVGHEVEVKVLSLLQTGAGVIVFADLNRTAA